MRTKMKNWGSASRKNHRAMGFGVMLVALTLVVLLGIGAGSLLKSKKSQQTAHLVLDQQKTSELADQGFGDALRLLRNGFSLQNVQAGYFAGQPVSVPDACAQNNSCWTANFSWTDAYTSGLTAVVIECQGLLCNLWGPVDAGNVNPSARIKLSLSTVPAIGTSQKRLEAHFSVKPGSVLDQGLYSGGNVGDNFDGFDGVNFVDGSGGTQGSGGFALDGYQFSFNAGASSYCGSGKQAYESKIKKFFKSNQCGGVVEPVVDGKIIETTANATRMLESSSVVAAKEYDSVILRQALTYFPAPSNFVSTVASCGVSDAFAQSWNGLSTATDDQIALLIGACRTNAVGYFATLSSDDLSKLWVQSSYNRSAYEYVKAIPASYIQDPDVKLIFKEAPVLTAESSVGTKVKQYKVPEALSYESVCSEVPVDPNDLQVFLRSRWIASQKTKVQGADTLNDGITQFLTEISNSASSLVISKIPDGALSAHGGGTVIPTLGLQKAKIACGTGGCRAKLTCQNVNGTRKTQIKIEASAYESVGLQLSNYLLDYTKEYTGYIEKEGTVLYFDGGLTLDSFVTFCEDSPRITFASNKDIIVATNTVKFSLADFNGSQNHMEFISKIGNLETPMSFVSGTKILIKSDAIPLIVGSGGTVRTYSQLTVGNQSPDIFAANNIDLNTAVLFGGLIEANLVAPEIRGEGSGIVPANKALPINVYGAIATNKISGANPVEGITSACAQNGYLNFIIRPRRGENSGDVPGTDGVQFRLVKFLKE